MDYQFRSIFSYLFINSIFIIIHAKEHILLDMKASGGELGWLTSPNEDGWEIVQTVVNGSLLYTYSVCNVATDIEQDNWLRTTFIQRPLEASRVSVELRFVVHDCNTFEGTSPSCRETFSLHLYETDMDVGTSFQKGQFRKITTVAPDEVTANKGDGWASVRVNVETRSVGPLSRRGFYLAFQDVGACVALLGVRVFYTTCPSIQRNLATFPEQVTATALTEVEGSCVKNSVTVGQAPPRMYCTAEGEWVVPVGQCYCRAGYQAVGQTCQGSDYANESDCNSFKYLAYTITYTTMTPIGLFCNLAALFVFFRETTKKTANTVFMTNLAISDVCFSLTLPFRLIYYFRDCQWDFWDWLCRLCVYSFYVNLYTSVLFLTGLSVLRYIAVVHPIQNRRIVTIRRASWACFFIWVFVAIMCIPFLMSGTQKVDNRTSCFEIKTTDWERVERVNYVNLVLGFLIPFITILGCYGCIIQKVFSSRRIQKKKKMQSQQWRTLSLIIVILSTFLLCFLPYHIVRTLHIRTVVKGYNVQKEKLLKILVITLCMAAANSCLNPLLYYFAGESFRSSLSRASRRLTINSLSDSVRLSRNSWRNQSGNQRKKNQSEDGKKAEQGKRTINDRLHFMSNLPTKT